MFLGTFRILLKYLFIAQIKSVFKVNVWKNPPCLFLSQKFMMVTNYRSLLEIRVGWPFCCWLGAQPLQGQSISLPPGISHFLTTLHVPPRLALAESLPVFLLSVGLYCNAFLPSNLFCFSFPGICSQRVWWRMLIPVLHGQSLQLCLK